MARFAIRLRMALGCALGAMPVLARAAQLDGASLSVWWGLPFAGVLLSIALFPLLAPHVWHRHYGKIAAGWAMLFLAGFAIAFGPHTAFGVFVHALLEEYLPFVLLLTALYTVAGGICVRGDLHGTPAFNSALLGLGVLLASVMGTTGAAMLLIRPLLRANARRKHVAHVVVFFIFLVANAGGSLSPLGDPPLFLGFLNGVSFFWTTVHLFLPMLLVCTLLLALFFLLDTYFYRRGHESERPFLYPEPGHDAITIEGKLNFALLALIVVLVLMSGLWKPGIAYDVAGTEVELQNLVRDLALIGVTFLSLAFTPRSARAGNAFDWAPIQEVAKLFAAIFITIAPVIVILRAGADGAFAPIVHLVTGADGRPVNAMYFWATGLLSSFLDNAPTYLVFFNLAGGDPQALMQQGAVTLAAISAGAVFMGANSYIGNAPNFMVKAIAEANGVRMPGFFAYLGWSFTVLVPVFLLVTWVFFSA
jgi:Na+/H+ antiporter NhaD/arsenite permease-like protein